MGDFFRGTWRADADFPHDKTGHFVRPDAPFRNWVTASGEPGPSGAAASRRSPAAITSSSRSPARGRTAPSSSAG